MRSAGQIPLSRALDNARKEAAVRYSGTAANGATETISPLIFHPASPSNLRPFGAPPSIGRREYPRKPLPLEGGRLCVEDSVVLVSLPFPHGEG